MLDVPKPGGEGRPCGDAPAMVGACSPVAADSQGDRNPHGLADAHKKNLVRRAVLPTLRLHSSKIARILLT